MAQEQDVTKLDLVIPAGKAAEEVVVLRAGCRAQWTFTAAETGWMTRHHVVLSAVFREGGAPDPPQEVAAPAKCRGGCEVCGCYDASVDGDLVLRLDNSFSWVNSKHVSGQIIRTARPEAAAGDAVGNSGDLASGGATPTLGAAVGMPLPILAPPGREMSWCPSGLDTHRDVVEVSHSGGAAGSSGPLSPSPSRDFVLRHKASGLCLSAHPDGSTHWSSDEAAAAVLRCRGGSLVLVSRGCGGRSPRGPPPAGGQRIGLPAHGGIGAAGHLVFGSGAELRVDFAADGTLRCTRTQRPLGSADGESLAHGAPCAFPDAWSFEDGETADIGAYAVEHIDRRVWAQDLEETGLLFGASLN
eukprot:TRINITY_DN11631_c0_g1_i1.p1 TRINITY_DN11631_c0_g1~~TRINITY_DN11631_c0_g1_i1.p1  ORF type:complete len:357 (+),score=49.39 TRINITY_DN11631_c0_g1_i1:103-1173(+)